MNVKPTAIAAILVALLAGCTLAPKYQRPELPIPENLPAYGANQGGGTTPNPKELAAAAPDWQHFFADPALQQLISTALANNRDLRQSALAVEQYQAQYRIQRAALIPSISASPYISRQRTFSGGSNVDIEIAAATVGITAYELDFFGRVRSLKEDALEQYLAMEETHKSAQISLVAEVARAYLTLLADRELLTVTEETFRNFSESYNIAEQREKEGVSSQLDLVQARTGMENARSNLAQYRRQVAQDINNLSLLVGVQQSDLEKEAGLLSDLQPLADLPNRLSSDILLHRPDIMAAEHTLKGTNANIGAARAAFFPTISLTANAGVLTADLGNLFDDRTDTWLFSPSVTVPIFTGGRLKAQLDVAEIRKENSIAQYEKTIQTAFREVADALAGQETFTDQLDAQKNTLEATQQYLALADKRYQEGLDSYLTMLDAQRSLFAARQMYVSTKLAQLANQVNLYKALGGGWQENLPR